MVDKNTLREMSQDVLVIPFSEKTAEELDKFCRTQVEAITIDRVEEFIMSFLTRTNDGELEKTYSVFATESSQESKILPETILPVLTEYIVLLSIDACEEEARKALYTLMLKNALLLAVKGDGFVAHPKVVAELFDKYNNYLLEEKVFRQDEENEVLADLLNTDNEGFTEKIGEADGDTIKAIVYDAAIFRYNNFIENIKIDTEHLIKGVYHLAKQLIYNTPWRYADTDVAHTIKKLLGESGEDNVQLCAVKEEWKDLIGSEDRNYGLTSVLLRLIDEDNNGIELSDSTAFKVNELAIYLYYELLAEAMKSEIEEQEE